MKNDLNIYRQILNEYEQKRTRHQAERDARISEIYREIPMIKEIDAEIKRAGIEAAISASNGKRRDMKDILEEMEEAKIAQLLSHGYDKDYLDLKYDCEKCKDTGFIGNEECTCFRQRLNTEYYKMSNIQKILKKENFSTFDLNIFSDEVLEEEGISPRENILKIVDASQNFISRFDDEKEYNLLFFGDTGLGKTFMLNCIAKELLDMGYTVIYQTSHDVLEIIEEYKFGKTSDIMESKSKYDYMLESDLLIIDDLGTENSNAFSNSEIFNIINSRNMNDKKMLISTNLTPAEIAKTYTDRIYSRILEKFNIYKFIGRDLRWQ